MDSGKVLLAIEEQRKWDQREKELLLKLDDIRRTREELRRAITEVKRDIAVLDSTLGGTPKGMTYRPAVQTGAINR